jgi:predicted Holliday junction resolvase-like endonuclease
MNLEKKEAGSQKLRVILGVFLILSLINVVSLVMRSAQIKALTAKINLQALIIEEKDKQLEADKVQYTSLAARLHKEIKKVGELEEKIKK